MRYSAPPLTAADRPDAAQPDPPPQVYAAHGLDRAAASPARRRLGWTSAAAIPATPGGAPVRAAWFRCVGTDGCAAAARAERWPSSDGPLPADSIFLGERDGAAWFAVDRATDVRRRTPSWSSCAAVSLLLPADEAATAGLRPRPRALASRAPLLRLLRRGHRGHPGRPRPALPGLRRATTSRAPIPR